MISKKIISSVTIVIFAFTAMVQAGWWLSEQLEKLRGLNPWVAATVSGASFAAGSRLSPFGKRRLSASWRAGGRGLLAKGTFLLGALTYAAGNISLYGSGVVLADGVIHNNFSTRRGTTLGVNIYDKYLPLYRSA